MKLSQRRFCLLIAYLLCFSCVGFSQISTEKLFREHRKAIEPYAGKTLSTLDNYTIYGEVSMGALTVPFELSMSSKSSYMKMEMMGSYFTQVSLGDTLQWSYDPLQKSYSFNKLDGSGPTNLEFSPDEENLDDILNEGWIAGDTFMENIDSLTVIRVHFTREPDEQLDLYFDPDNYQIIGTKDSSNYQFFGDYKEFANGCLLPTYFIDISPGSQIVARLTDYDLTSPIDQSVFVMNEDVKSAYQDFIEEGNEPPTSAVQTYYNRGKEFAENGELHKAIEMYDKALKLLPTDATVLNMRGIARSSLGDLSGAVSDFEKAIENVSEPEYSLYNNLGMAKDRLGDYDGAERDFLKALEIDSLQAGAYGNLSGVYITKSDFENSFLYAGKATVMDPTNVLYTYYKAVSATEIGKYEIALEAYDKAGKLGLDNAVFYNQKGVAEYKFEQYEAAFKSFRLAIAKDSSDVQYYVNAAEAMKKFDSGGKDAIEIYDYLVSVDSNNAEYYTLRGIAYYELALYDKAKVDIDRAIQFGRSSAFLYNYSGYIKENTGDFVGAIDDFSLSLVFKEDPNIYYRRGLVKIKKDNKSGACEDFKKSSEMGDENGKAALAEHCKL